MKIFTSSFLILALSGCIHAQTPTQVDWLTQVKNKTGYIVNTNTTNTNGGYVVFPPVSYNPYDSPSTCFDNWGNPVQQPLPAAGQPAFAPQSIVLWNSLSPSLPFANGTGTYGLVQKMVVTSPATTNTGPCGAPLPVETDYGLNTNGYFFGRGGLATDNPIYNSIQSLQGGVVANSFTAGVLYPAGTTVCTAMSGATCTMTTVLGAPAYLGGHVDTGHSSGPPQGNSIQAFTNPFSGGEGLVAGQVYYDDSLHCEQVYSGATWGCIGASASGSPQGPINSLQINAGGGAFGGFSALTYNPITNVVTITGTAGQGIDAPVYAANAGGTNAEFQGSQFSVLGNGHVRTNGWLDFGETTAPPTQAGHALLYADSGTHQLLLSLNGGSFAPIGGGGGGGVTTFNGRSGVVALTATDVSGAGGSGTFNVASSGDATLQATGSGLAGAANLMLKANAGTNCWNMKSQGGGAAMVFGYSNSCAGVFSLTTEVTYSPTGVTFAQPITVPSCTGCGGGGGSTAPLVFTGLAGAPALSTAGNASLYFNTSNLDLEASYNGGAYTGLKSPVFNCTAAGASSCIQQVSGTFGITGAGDASFQTVAIGSGAPLSINSAGTITTSGGVSAASASFTGTAAAGTLSVTSGGADVVGNSNFHTGIQLSGGSLVMTGLGQIFGGPNGFNSNGSPGVSCSGSPTGSFASVLGIVTHC